MTIYSVMTTRNKIMLVSVLLIVSWLFNSELYGENKVYNLSFIEDKKSFFNQENFTAKIELNRKDDVVAFESWDGPDDLSAVMWGGADYRGLYLKYKVTDNVFYQEKYKSSQAWQGDSVQVAFKLDNKAGRCDMELCIHLLDGKKADLYQHAQGFLPRGNIDSISLRIARRGKIVYYYLFIPWELFYPFNPFESDFIKTSFLVNDNDGHGRKSYVEWTKGIGESKNSSYYGKFILPKELNIHEVSKNNFLYLYPEKKSCDIGTSLYIVCYGGVKTGFLTEKHEKEAFIEILSGNKLVVKKKILFDKGVISRKFISVKLDSKFAMENGNFKIIGYWGKDKIEHNIKIQNPKKVKGKIQALKEEINRIKAKIKWNNEYYVLAIRYYGVIAEMITYVEEEFEKKRYSKTANILTKLELLTKKLNNYILEAENKNHYFSESSIKLLADVPPEGEDIHVKNGWFYRGERPIWLNGFVGFVKIYKDWQIQNYIGMKVVGLDFHANTYIPSPNPDDDKSPEYVNDWCNNFRKYDMYLMGQIPLHYLPNWVYQKYPEGKINNPFWNFSPFHPALKEVLERMYKNASLSLNKNKDRILAINLTNEPFIFDFSDTGPFVEEAFKKWLKRKYGSINGLNSIWKKNYGNFDDIGIPWKSSKEPTNEELSQAIFYDWLTFRRESVFSFFKWMHQTWRKYSDIPVMEKLLAESISGENIIGYPAYRCGIDIESITEISDYAGCDMGMGFTTVGQEKDESSQYEYAINFSNNHFGFDLLRSFGPGKPVINTENHFIKDASGHINYPANYVRAVLWGQVLHGMGATTAWVWERLEKHLSLTDSIITRPYALEGFVRTTEEINHFIPLLTNLNNLPKQVAIIYSWPSLVRNRAHFNKSMEVYKSLVFQGKEIRFITDKQIKKGEAKKYDIIIAANALRIEDDTYKKLKEYVGTGKTLILVGDCFKEDEHGFPLRNQWSKTDRRVVTYNDTITYQEVGNSINKVFQKQNLVDRYTVTTMEGGIPWGVEWRVVPFKKGEEVYNVLFVINWSKGPKKIKVMDNKLNKIVGNNLDLTSDKIYKELMLEEYDVKIIVVDRSNIN